MALARIAIPSPNYSSSRPSSRLLVVHTSEGATTKESLGNFLAQPSADVSYQAGFDNNRPDQIAVYVKHHDKAWAAYDANSWGEHGCLCTPSGASSGWSRTTWLEKDNMLRACGAWLAEEAGRYGVPLVKINGADVAAGRSGVCGHGDISAAGVPGGHTDPGGSYPWDVCLAYAHGGAPFPEPPPTSPSTAPPFPGTLLINFTEGHGTSTWQARMAERGWTIAVDDLYGGQSEAVCRSFQQEKGLAHDGIVGPETWAAAFTAPIT